MASQAEIAHVAYTRLAALGVLDTHFRDEHGLCFGCGNVAWPCRAAATATRMRNWCDRRIQAIDDELSQRATRVAVGVLAAA